MSAISRSAAWMLVFLMSTDNALRAQSGGSGLQFGIVMRSVVETRLREFGGDNKQREATLKRQFADAGCDESHLSEQAVKGSKLPNLICILPGNSGRVVIVGAHYDHVDVGDGVVDNWSGASLLPSLYQALKMNGRSHTYIFIGFSDEEKGEIGSHFYAQHMSKDDVAATHAMVNMDTLGLGPTAVWESRSDKSLVEMLARVGHGLEMPLLAINVERVGSTDSEQFRARKIPSITIHTYTQEAVNAKILHSNKDNLSEIHLDDYYQNYRLVAAYLVALDSWLKESEH